MWWMPGRGNRRSAASGGCSEAISRKCPDWRSQQWPGIGWHDGGQENPAPTELQGVRCKPGRVVREADPYGSVTRGTRAGRCGERIERRRRRMQRDERVAAVKILSVRRKAARKFWAPQQDHRPLRGRYMRCGADKGRPGGPPLRFLYPLFICALRRINLPGAGVCLCRPTRCGPRPGVFPGRWLFPPGKSRCGVRPGSPGPGL